MNKFRYIIGSTKETFLSGKFFSVYLTFFRPSNPLTYENDLGVAKEEKKIKKTWIPRFSDNFPRTLFIPPETAVKIQHLIYTTTSRQSTKPGGASAGMAPRK